MQASTDPAVVSGKCCGACLIGETSAPCSKPGTREIPLMLMRFMSTRDRHKLRLVCDTCLRFLLRCSQNDAQHHRRCTSTIAARCFLRITAFRLGDGVSFKVDLTATGACWSCDSAPRAPDAAAAEVAASAPVSGAVASPSPQPAVAIPTSASA